MDRNTHLDRSPERLALSIAIRHLTYENVPARDTTKATWYEKSSAGLRRAILENCGPGDRTTLELGMRDHGELGDLLRRQAYGTVGCLTDEELSALLSSTDEDALEAACCNKSLRLEHRQQILKRFA
jgi:hypothetical protein